MAHTNIVTETWSSISGCGRMYAITARTLTEGRKINISVCTITASISETKVELRNSGIWVTGQLKLRVDIIVVGSWLIHSKANNDVSYFRLW